MRNRALHDALRDFALEAAAQLTADVRDGAELAFDVLEERGRGTVLYRYSPLSAEFIGERWERLRRLPGCAAAADALAGGAELYLRVHGGSAGPDSEPALRAMLERLYGDASAFDFPEERFERVYAELERALYDNALRTAIVTPLVGLSLDDDRLDLGDGLFLVSAERFDAPAEVAWDAEGRPRALCVLRRDTAADAPLPLAEAARRFDVLLRALRLLRSGGLALGPLAFGRVDEGPWRPLALGRPGAARGGRIAVAAGEQDELMELMGLVQGPGAGPVAWALARFEMGLDRPHDSEALSDYLLALTALFGADDEAGRAALPLRVAALCADPPERGLVANRIERAFTLEARLKAGAAVPDDDRDTPRTLALELEECLRALLRDVVCGYLEPNLRAAADDVLVTSGAPVDIVAADLRSAPSGDGDRGEGDRLPVVAADLRSAPSGDGDRGEGDPFAVVAGDLRSAPSGDGDRGEGDPLPVVAGDLRSAPSGDGDRGERDPLPVVTDDPCEGDPLPLVAGDPGGAEAVSAAAGDPGEAEAVSVVAADLRERDSSDDADPPASETPGDEARAYVGARTSGADRGARADSADQPAPEGQTSLAVDGEGEAGVTHSSDWDANEWEDDADNWSAPV